MIGNISKYHNSILTLRKTIEDFTKEVDNQKLTNIAAGKWSVKEVLAHIVFWHQYYAKQYASLASGKKPFVFTSKGGSVRNQEGVDSISGKSKKDLIKLLNQAQASLHKSIVIKNVPYMNYTDKNRYSTKEFLEVVIGHVKRHTIQIKKATE